MGRPVSPSRSRYARFAWAVLLFNLGVIVWGAYVRASGSGAGCGSHWPLCNGVIVPRAPAIATLVELSHRLTSGVALLLVVALAVMAFRVEPKGSPVRTASVWSVVFIFGEALIGAALVLLEHVAQSLSTKRALSMTLHLTNTFLLLTALSLTAFWASGGARPQTFRTKRFVPFAALFGVLLLVGTSGGIAALGDTLFPVRSIAEGIAMDRSATAHLFVRLRFLHPLFAAIGSLSLITFTTIVASVTSFPDVKRAARVVSALVVVQVLAGLLNLWLLAPIPMQLVHLLLADTVWIALVVLTARTLATNEFPASGTGSDQSPIISRNGPGPSSEVPPSTNSVAPVT